MPSFGRWQINKMLHLSFILKAMKKKRKQVPLDIVNLETFNYVTCSTALSIIVDMIFTLSSAETRFDEEGTSDAFVSTRS